MSLVVEFFSQKRGNVGGSGTPLSRGLCFSYLEKELRLIIM